MLARGFPRASADLRPEIDTVFLPTRANQPLLKQPLDLFVACAHMSLAAPTLYALGLALAITGSAWPSWARSMWPSLDNRVRPMGPMRARLARGGRTNEAPARGAPRLHLRVHPWDGHDERREAPARGAPRLHRILRFLAQGVQNNDEH